MDKSTPVGLTLAVVHLIRPIESGFLCSNFDSFDEEVWMRIEKHFAIELDVSVNLILIQKTDIFSGQKNDLNHPHPFL
jgi:hypothetical protein